MITLPDPSPPQPSLDSATAYLRSISWAQRRTLAGAAALGVVWMATQAAIPLVVGNTVDAGLVHADRAHLTRGCLLLVVLGLTAAITGMYRHRFSVSNWWLAAIRSQHAIGHHIADQGLAVTAGTTTGEVVQAVSTDAPRFADLMDSFARAVGSLAAFVAVSVYLLRIDARIGLFVIAGLPLLAAGSTLLIRPLQTRQARHRQAEGDLTSLGADTVAGLRVLRGIGGEEVFTARYAARSQQVRQAGVVVAGLQALLEAGHVLLPGLFLAGLTWLAAHGVLDGQLSVGELVTVYAVTAFLRMPLETATQVLAKWVRAEVAAGRMVAVLVKRAPAEDDAGERPASSALLHDPLSGLTVPPGRLTALVCARPETGIEITDRFARLALDGPAPTLGGVALDRLPTDEVRRRILLSEAEPRLFTGTLREQVDPDGQHSDDEVLAALRTADAEDVLAALPEGLAAPVGERGRDFSGGQRQRLALARAVLRAGRAEVEVLVEPTSAVDAHTEARIAERLRSARAGATTLIVSSSPLVLDRCDRVVLLHEGEVVAEGTHRELLHTSVRYRDVVVRSLETAGNAGVAR